MSYRGVDRRGSIAIGADRQGEIVAGCLAVELARGDGDQLIVLPLATQVFGRPPEASQVDVDAAGLREQGCFAIEELLMERLYGEAAAVHAGDEDSLQAWGAKEGLGLELVLHRLEAAG